MSCVELGIDKADHTGNSSHWLAVACTEIFLFRPLLKEVKPEQRREQEHNSDKETGRRERAEEEEGKPGEVAVEGEEDRESAGDRTETL